MKVIRLSTITWRGSVGDLATDCAYLLTPAEGRELARILIAFADNPKQTADKYQAQGRTEETP